MKVYFSYFMIIIPKTQELKLVASKMVAHTKIFLDTNVFSLDIFDEKIASIREWNSIKLDACTCNSIIVQGRRGYHLDYYRRKKESSKSVN